MLQMIKNLFQSADNAANKIFLYFAKGSGWVLYGKTQPAVCEIFSDYYKARDFAQSNYPNHKLCWYNGQPVECGDG